MAARVRMSAPTLAPALARLRNEINSEWPNRDRRTDGWLGDPAHQARLSQHNPDDWNLVRAIDIDKDGINVKRVLKSVIAAPGVWYVIHDGRIWSKTHGWKARRYTGANPHESHIHVSMLLDYDAAFVKGSWLDKVRRPAKRWREGDRGDALKRWQRLLGVEADGVYGPATARAVNRIKREQGWRPDGVLGPGVRRVLKEREG